MTIDQNLLASKDAFVAILYLISSILFVLGIKRLSKPKTASQGNMLGASGMLVAVIAAVIDFGLVINVAEGIIETRFQYWYILLIAILLGTIVGVWSAIGVKMTGMPQMVAIFNGFGGGASFLVAGVVFWIRIDSRCHT
jgi:H+-translocating NAD(P) transhydrogenase subunit beta